MVVAVVVVVVVVWVHDRQDDAELGLVSLRFR
jgi:hypothetical protein